MTREQLQLYELYKQLDKDVLAKTLALLISNQCKIPNIIYKDKFLEFPTCKPIKFWYTTTNLYN